MNSPKIYFSDVDEVTGSACDATISDLSQLLDRETLDTERRKFFGSKNCLKCRSMEITTQRCGCPSP